jgi:hypothetical protein
VELATAPAPVTFGHFLAACYLSLVGEIMLFLLVFSLVLVSFHGNLSRRAVRAMAQFVS